MTRKLRMEHLATVAVSPPNYEDIINTPLRVSHHQVSLAILRGNLKHQDDVIVAIAEPNYNYTRFSTNKARADYIRDAARHLVPPHQPGQEPSDKALADIFQAQYFVNTKFVRDYLRWLNANLRPTIRGFEHVY